MADQDPRELSSEIAATILDGEVDDYLFRLLDAVASRQADVGAIGYRWRFEDPALGTFCQDDIGLLAGATVERVCRQLGDPVSYSEFVWPDSATRATALLVAWLVHGPKGLTEDRAWRKVRELKGRTDEVLARFHIDRRPADPKDLAGT